MNKRRFLTSIAGLVAASRINTADALNKAPEAGQTVLTVVGAIDHVNREKLNPVTDQLMHKFAIGFERAHTFSLAELLTLPPQTIKPTMEYDQRVHQLTGPRLLDVLAAAGAQLSDTTRIVFHGIDGYSPEVTWAQAKKYNYIVATHLDGKLLAIGGFGPLFAIYDADRIAELAAKPLNQRFFACPWGLYCIEVLNS